MRDKTTRVVDGDTDAFCGTLLDGRYRIDRKVAEGGFATVYAGFHLTLAIEVAIKIVRWPVLASAERRAEYLGRFMDEGRLVMRLRHDNIVRTLDQGVVPSEPPTPYLVMEWCGTETLDQLIVRSREGLTLSEALSLMEPLLDAMAHAHSIGIAHRDLKPGNVMVARVADGSVAPRIIDFGIAKLFEADAAAGSGDTHTRSEQISFTPAYASPEQMTGARTGPWTDVHALGLIFVELLTAQPPLREGGMRRVLDPIRPTPSSFGVDAGAFEPVIARALAVRPGDRYRHAAEMQRAVAEAAVSAGIAAAPRLGGGVRIDALGRTEPALEQPNAAGAGKGPVSFTQQTVVSSRERPRGSRAAWIGAGSLAAAGLVGSVLGLWVWRSPSSALDEPSPQIVASAVPSASVPRERLADLTLQSLEARVEKAGLTVRSRSEQLLPDRTLTVQFEKDGKLGAAYLNVLNSDPKTPPEVETLASLGAVRRWIELDRANGYELVYAVDGRYVLSLTGTSEATIRVFEAVANGLSFEIEGNSIVGPNPAMDPHETRRLWRAKSLHELSLVELSLRIGALGGDVASASVESPPWLIHAGRGVERAQLTFHGGPAGSTEGGPQSLARLRKAARPFSYARDGDTLLVCEGALCASADFLRDALEGTHAEVVAEPPYR